MPPPPFSKHAAAAVIVDGAVVVLLGRVNNQMAPREPSIEDHMNSPICTPSSLSVGLISHLTGYQRDDPFLVFPLQEILGRFLLLSVKDKTWKSSDNFDMAGGKGSKPPLFPDCVPSTFSTCTSHMCPHSHVNQCLTYLQGQPQR